MFSSGALNQFVNCSSVSSPRIRNARVNSSPNNRLYRAVLSFLPIPLYTGIDIDCYKEDEHAYDKKRASKAEPCFRACVLRFSDSYHPQRDIVDANKASRPSNRKPQNNVFLSSSTLYTNYDAPFLG